MKALTVALLPFFIALVVPVASIQAQSTNFTPGAGRVIVWHAGIGLSVWYFLPENASADAPVLIVMHGVNRDADRYRDEWLPHARKHGFILVAPEFSEAEFPGSAGYNLGGAPDPRAIGQGAFSFIEPVFDAVKAATGNRSERYHLYGHSAGAQFVHRFLYFVPGAQVEKAVAANAGWWTLPDPALDFPYGLRGADVDAAALAAMIQRPLVVLLGTEDTDPNQLHLSRTPEALAQGAHRFARGHTLFEAGTSRASALGVPLGWRLSTAPGVGHSDKGVAPFAVPLLFGQ